MSCMTLNYWSIVLSTYRTLVITGIQYTTLEDSRRKIMQVSRFNDFPRARIRAIDIA